MRLKQNIEQGLADFASYGSAALVFDIPTNGRVPGSATFKHTGTDGYWYVSLGRVSGPTSSDYSMKLGPGESLTDHDPNVGEIWALADGDVDGDLHWVVQYA